MNVEKYVRKSTQSLVFFFVPKAAEHCHGQKDGRGFLSQEMAV